MNKFNLLLTAAAVVFSTPAMARTSDGGFVDVNVITVEEAKNMNDDAYVILHVDTISKVAPQIKNNAAAAK